MKRTRRDSFTGLDRLAHYTSDIKPMSPALRRRWEIAKLSGKRVSTGRPRKDARS